MNHRDIKFPKDKNAEFARTLRQRVKGYFEENNISRYANGEMKVKTVAMLLIYLVPYFLMVFGVVTNPWAMLAMWSIMGVGIAGIGLSVMHDAIHGSYSRNKTVNKYLGMLMNFVGGSALNWKMQHNVLHHSYTNVEGVDEDIAPASVLRFSPHAKKLGIHKYQHYYVWFLYGLMTLSWTLGKDFKRLKDYYKKGLIKESDKPYGKTVAILTLSKIAYVAYILIIPIIVLPVAWYIVLLYFFVMHFIAGLALACIFQPAHVVPEAHYPLVDENNMLEDNWAVHQLQTTTNFAPNSGWFTWYVGGLNYQIEHHLFPNICHVHYPIISAIVEKTAREFNIPYHSQPTFAMALKNHAKMIKQLGR